MCHILVASLPEQFNKFAIVYVKTRMQEITFRYKTVRCILTGFNAKTVEGPYRIREFCFVTYTELYSHL